jgi:hypothetical protein
VHTERNKNKKKMGNSFTMLHRHQQQGWFFFIIGLVSALVALVWAVAIDEAINNISIMATWLAILFWTRFVFDIRGKQINDTAMWLMFSITATAGLMVDSSIMMLIGFGGITIKMVSHVWDRWLDKIDIKNDIPMAQVVGSTDDNI